MQLKTVFIVLIIVLSTQKVKSQNIEYGSVGDKKLTENFIRSLQMIYPEFAYTTNNEIFVKRIQKYYTVPLAAADQARKLGIDKDPAVQQDLETIRQIAEDKYLAALYYNEISVNTTVSNEEALNYYNTHNNEFTIPAEYSFLQSFIYDTTPNGISMAQKKMSALAKYGNAEVGFKYGNKESFVIIFEENKIISPTQNEFKIITSLKLGEVSEPVFVNGMLSLFCLIDYKKELIRPFDEVKEMCLQRARTIKVNNAGDQIKSNAINDYPVILYDFKK